MTISLITARDRILAIDAEKQELQAEKDALLAFIDKEGFALKNELTSQAVDQDWRSWKKGDTVEVIHQNDEGLPIGGCYIVKSVEDSYYEGRYAVQVYVGASSLWTCAIGLGNENLQHPFKLVARA